LAPEHDWANGAKLDSAGREKCILLVAFSRRMVDVRGEQVAFSRKEVELRANRAHPSPVFVQVFILRELRTNFRKC
jgi:hypothetical protein